MPGVLSLEADESIKKSIDVALKGISDHINHKAIDSLAEFDKYIAALNPPKKEDDQIHLIILAADLIPPKDTTLWIKNLRNTFSQKGFGLVDNPVRIVILAFEDQHLHPQYFEIPEVFTFLIKPADPLILKEMFGFAITGYKQLRGQEIKFRSVLDNLEMLKNIHFDEISEVGFVTSSDTEFKPGVVSKYYSPLFNINANNSAFARLIHCGKHPKKEGFFQCYFEFIGLENDQLLNIRKKIAGLQTVHRKGDESFAWFANHQKTPDRPSITVAIAIFDEVVRKNIVDSLKRNFKNIRITELDTSIDRYEQSIVCDLALLDDLRSTEAYLKNFDLETKKIQISQHHFGEVQFREKLQFFTDIIHLPVDRAYLNRKIHLLNPSLVLQEQSNLPAIHGGFDIKAVMPVQITQASENHVEFSYQRALPLNEIREFAIHGDETLVHTEVKGRCHFVQKNNNKDLPFSHQFILLGQKDFYTKQMRIWMHRLYVSEAEKKL